MKRSSFIAGRFGFHTCYFDLPWGDVFTCVSVYFNDHSNGSKVERAIKNG